MNEVPSVTHIIVICDTFNVDIYDKYKSIIEKTNKKLFKMEDVINIGKESIIINDYEKPKKDDLAIIMFTSGSTGNPKVI